MIQQKLSIARLIKLMICVKQLAAIIKSSGESQFEIDNALSMCEDDFPKVWFDRLNRINNGNL